MKTSELFHEMPAETRSGSTPRAPASSRHAPPVMLFLVMPGTSPGMTEGARSGMAEGNGPERPGRRAEVIRSETAADSRVNLEACREGRRRPLRARPPAPAGTVSPPLRPDQPSGAPPVATIRWQGTIIGSGLRRQALPTARGLESAVRGDIAIAPGLARRDIPHRLPLGAVVRRPVRRNGQVERTLPAREIGRKLGGRLIQLRGWVSSPRPYPRRTVRSRMGRPFAKYHEMS